MFISNTHVLLDFHQDTNQNLEGPLCLMHKLPSFDQCFGEIPWFNVSVRTLVPRCLAYMPLWCLGEQRKMDGTTAVFMGNIWKNMQFS